MIIEIELLIKRITNLIEDLKVKFANEFQVEIILHSENVFRSIFHFNYCMAQIIVEKPEFAPYRYVCFEVCAITNGRADNVYCWHDDDKYTISDVIFSLEKGIEFAVNFIN